MPQNWTHYIGVDLDYPQKTIERLLADSYLPKRIAETGRTWALEHYEPVAVAKRFLEIVFNNRTHVDRG